MGDSAYNRAAFAKKQLDAGRMKVRKIHAKRDESWEAQVATLECGTLTLFRPTEHEAITGIITYLDERRLIDWTTLEVL